jgi:hypothetical protein
MEKALNADCEKKSLNIAFLDAKGAHAHANNIEAEK